jgi:hypothetical protein
MNYQIDKEDNRLLIIRFKSKAAMNAALSKISERYEGLTGALEGHNFPASYVQKSDAIYDTVQKHKIIYVIGVYHVNSLEHEKLHAKYYLDATYKKKIDEEWAQLDEVKKGKIIQSLTKMGYCDKVFIDEYQAYRYTEKPNFFGFKW